jgi:hypothetical protein
MPISIYSDQSRQANWFVRKKTDVTLSITVTQSSVAYDLSTTTFIAEFFQVNGIVPFLTLTQGSGITNGGATGIVTLALTDTQLDLIPNQYFWKLRTTAPTDYLWLNGVFQVNDYVWDGDGNSSATIDLTVGNNNIDLALTLAGGSLTFSNGITNTGGAVKLGGNLTQNTVISDDGSGRNLEFGQIGTRIGNLGVHSSSADLRAGDYGTLGTQIYEDSDGFLTITSSAMDGFNIVEVNPPTVANSSTSIKVNSNEVLISGSSASFSGLKSNADYSANYTARNYTDKGYSDAINQKLIIPETVITSASTIYIAQQNNTLATALTAITVTIGSTSTFTRTVVTLTGTSLVLTFPANSLCVNSDGTASGTNTCTLTGTSGDVYEVMTAKRGATYSVIAKSLTQ